MTVNPGVNSPRWLIISLQIPNKDAISWQYTLKKLQRQLILLLEIGLLENATRLFVKGVVRVFKKLKEERELENGYFH